MNPNDANAFVDQVTGPRTGERLTAASNIDPTGLFNLADVAVEGTGLAVDLAAGLAEVSVEAAGGLLEVIGGIIAGILS